MINREKIIKGLKCCKSTEYDDEYDCHSCPYDYNGTEGENRCLRERLIPDVLKLLEEQEPHVLTLDEAVDGSHVYYVEFQYHMDRGWVKCDFDRMYVDGEVAMLFLRNKTFYQQKEDYGRLWRLWSARPTYDQMKAVKWDGT